LSRRVSLTDRCAHRPLKRHPSKCRRHRRWICHRSPRVTVHKTNCRGEPDSLVDLNRLLRWTSRCPTLVPEPQSNCRGASPPLRNLASTPSTRRQLDGVALMLAHRSPRWMLLHSKCRTLRRWIRRSSASACVEINQRVTLVTFTSRRWREVARNLISTQIFPNSTRPPRRRWICHRSQRVTVHETNFRARHSLVDLRTGP